MWGVTSNWSSKSLRREIGNGEEITLDTLGCSMDGGDAIKVQISGIVHLIRGKKTLFSMHVTYS